MGDRAVGSRPGNVTWRRVLTEVSSVHQDQRPPGCGIWPLSLRTPCKAPRAPRARHPVPTSATPLRSWEGVQEPRPVGLVGSGQLPDHKKPQDSLLSLVRWVRLWGCPRGWPEQAGGTGANVLLPTHLDRGREASTDSVKLPLYCGCFDNFHLPGVTYSGFKYT